MSNYENIRTEILNEILGGDPASEKYLNQLKALKALNDAENAEKLPDNPEQTGAKAWFGKHSDAFIKVGGTLAAITLVGFVENKFDVIFRSKAAKYI